VKERILIVDDERNVRLNYRVTLETEGFHVVEAPDGTAALSALAETNFDLVILDMRMPEMGGLDLLETMRQKSMQLASRPSCYRLFSFQDQLHPRPRLTAHVPSPPEEA
jgi:CheY-like chemotaxis protein